MSSTAASPTPFVPAEIKHGSLKNERRWAMIGAYIALAVFVLFFMIPPFHMLMTSLKSSAEIADLSGNPWIVRSPTLSNYWELLTQGNYMIHFRNSVIVTVCTVLISMIISTMAAFALARMKFWGSATLATGVFLTYLVPETLLFIPMFQIVGSLGLYNNLWAMVLIFPTLTVPFCTWIMIGYFASIPKELDEAALIDGASHIQMLLKIFIPVALPGILAAMIFAFTVSWAAFIYPIAFLVSSDQMVLTVGIVSDLIRADTFQWGKIMAGALMAALPPLLVYAFLMDYYIAGLTAGATKG
ncbi:carbohydrate ABC transporter permease [Roseomonas aerophila]|uniref:Carbohydrate ABC transporter permease n=1 Tax=Teichococcus aerophilus TaxID=1224513 RepID=A0ABR7RR55_9PROT|nr:carbohydrate ABC transporter permease [Pseudoroseomonas aerophila]MBC9209084.1 carbohydrate ABC transporter permease [Pseudoroseomonas aerophila]